MFSIKIRIAVLKSQLVVAIESGIGCVILGMSCVILNESVVLFVGLVILIVTYAEVRILVCCECKSAVRDKLSLCNRAGRNSEPTHNSFALIVAENNLAL